MDFIKFIKIKLRDFSYPPSILLVNTSLEAYLNIFDDEDKIRFFINSYIISIIVTLLTLFISILSGYSFSRFNFKFKKLLNLTIISTQTIPPITLLIPYFGIVVFFRIYDTYYALVLTYLVFTLPYATLMMTIYFNTLPRDLDYAVILDGVTNFYDLFKVLFNI